MKLRTLMTIATAAVLALVALGLGTVAAKPTPDVPTLKVGYVFTTHHTPLIAAMSKGEAFRDRDIYLKPVIPKEKYELYEKGKKLANLDVMVTKTSSENCTLFAMNRLDVALVSITAIMSCVDKGIPIKVLCPLHTDGMGLVFPKGSTVKGWDGFTAYIKKSKRPVTIGYHAPTSAPKIILEGALNKAGFKVSENPNDPTAQVVLVDLRATSNLIPALVSKQVDGWVGPSPFPEVAAVQGVGTIVMDLKDFPPKGQWNNFPCCVMAARDEVIMKHGVAVKALVGLMTESGKWCNSHKEEASNVTASWIGIPVEAVRRSAIVYTTTPSKGWLRGVDVYLETLNRLKDFIDKLEGKTLKEITPLLFDFRYVTKGQP